MEKYTYQPQGTCSYLIHFELDGDMVSDLRFDGGCSGNLQGLARLCTGRRVDELVTLLRGIDCQNGTSCPDQLAQALESVCAAAERKR